MISIDRHLEHLYEIVEAVKHNRRPYTDLKLGSYLSNNYNFSNPKELLDFADTLYWFYNTYSEQSGYSNIPYLRDWLNYYAGRVIPQAEFVGTLKDYTPVLLKIYVYLLKLDMLLQNDKRGLDTMNFWTLFASIDNINDYKYALDILDNQTLTVFYIEVIRRISECEDIRSFLTKQELCNAVNTLIQVYNSKIQE